jgi:hypothetical protein
VRCPIIGFGQSESDRARHLECLRQNRDHAVLEEPPTRRIQALYYHPSKSFPRQSHKRPAYCQSCKQQVRGVLVAVYIVRRRDKHACLSSLLTSRLAGATRRSLILHCSHRRRWHTADASVRHSSVAETLDWAWASVVAVAEAVGHVLAQTNRRASLVKQRQFPGIPTHQGDNFRSNAVAVWPGCMGQGSSSSRLFDSLSPRFVGLLGTLDSRAKRPQT